MKTLFKNAQLVNVLSKKIEICDILVADDKIIGVGKYNSADKIVDCKNKFVCPGLIDGHMHIESTMLAPNEFAKVALAHGTTAVVADPHEIANVCGTEGIQYMLDSTENLPLTFYFMMPSCVPATKFDESYETLNAQKIAPFYENKRVLGLAEVMNYVGVINGEKSVLDKIAAAKKLGKIVDGHAPLLSGKDLDVYINAGIKTDHECSSFEEGLERISKGQWLQIREGTAAKNLRSMVKIIGLPCSNRALFATDDRSPNDLLHEGHIDQIIRKAVKLGAKPIDAISLATCNAATCYNLQQMGAIAPGHLANMLILNDLKTFDIDKVYCQGKLVAEKGTYVGKALKSNKTKYKKLYNSFHIAKLDNNSLNLNIKGKHTVRVIQVIPSEIITKEKPLCLDFDKNNGIDVKRDILKIAVFERHKGTSHKSIGFINGMGLKKGAIASSISHDSHNLIVVGTNDEDMLLAINRIIKLGGGNVVVADSKVLAELPLPVAGLMSDKPANEVADANLKIKEILHDIGINKNIDPFMNMAFISLPVIPFLKLTSQGLIDVKKFEKTSLLID